jgi:BASS family bile acid:Na+ symporter
MTDITLSFSPASLRVLNLCLAFIMFGVALSIKPRHFHEVVRQPGGILTGIVSQWVLLPALTFLLVMILEPPPGIALGMFLVAACPGGNVSNYYSLIAKANVALSVSLTAFSTLFCVIGTPLVFQFWGNLYGPTADLLQRIDISFVDVLLQVFLILTLPVTLGVLFAKRFPALTARISSPIRHLSFLFLVGFIVVAFYTNVRQFVLYIEMVFGLVLLHNAGALAVGYLAARSVGQPVRNRRSISIETGIQNSGLGLILIFTFFSGYGEMALVAAWWGVWHMVAGLAMAGLFSFQESRRVLAIQESTT